MNNGSGVSRGDRNRNARLSRLRAAVPVTNAIVGIDLADRKQMLVVTDHDSKVLARRTFRCKAWDLGAALDWAADRAHAKGFAGVTVACEPTGHRWMVLAQLAAERGMSFVCVQPAASSWARKSEDLTTDKTDDKDAVLIARLTGQLRCYLPEPVDQANAAWTRLRHLGSRREELLEQHVSCVQTVRDLLECVWPPRSRQRSTRSARPRGSQPWLLSWDRDAAVTVVTWTGPTGSGWPGSSEPSAPSSRAVAGSGCDPVGPGAPTDAPAGGDHAAAGTTPVGRVCAVSVRHSALLNGTSPSLRSGLRLREGLAGERARSGPRSSRGHRLEAAAAVA
jgi:hypothetical protein